MPDPNALVVRSPPALNEDNSVLVRLGQQYGLLPTKVLDIVKNTLMPSDAKNITDDHVMAFLLVADQYKLNPFTKQIYAFPSRSGGIQAVVGVDGWYFLMNTHPQFAGLEFIDHFDAEDASKLVAITARIFRRDRPDHQTEATEYMAECARDTEPWKKWPRRMLRHKAAIQAARIAFSLAGIVDPDEAERAIESLRTTRVTRVDAGMAGLRTALVPPPAQLAAPAALPVPPLVPGTVPEAVEREPGEDEPEGGP